MHFLFCYTVHYSGDSPGVSEALIQISEVQKIRKYLRQSTTPEWSIYTTATASSRGWLWFYTVLAK